MAGSESRPETSVLNRDQSTAAVVIIGAGMSGICTAVDLIKRNNVRSFIILEKSSGLGGTWHENTYPGCSCDIWSTLYSYSFAQNSDWTRQYPGQQEILAYLERVAKEYKLTPHISFRTTVETAKWDDQEKKWKTKVTVLRRGEDKELDLSFKCTITSDFLVSAVGQLNQPHWPDLEGLETFQGKKMHSAKWDWSYDLKDKKIALVGNGCSAAQILPEIQKIAMHVTVFQRTPNWVIPRMDSPISRTMRNLFHYLPPIRWTKRALQMNFRELLHTAVIDSESFLGKTFRTQAQNHLHAQLVHHPEMWEKLTPDYAVGCKRAIISDDYFPSLVQPNVTLETRRIHSVSGRSIQVVENDYVVDSATDYDLLICATGFKAVDFMHPISMYGRNGRSLRDVWKEGAQAFNGTCIEDMPNFGMLYGPNTNLGHNSIILMIEAQSRYINGLIKFVLDARRSGKPVNLTPKKAKIDAYNTRIQNVLQRSSFNDSRCKSWYKTDAGLITNNWSGTVVEYQKLLSKIVFDEWEIECGGNDAAQNKTEVHLGRVKEESLFSLLLCVGMSVLMLASVLGRYLA